MTDTEAPPVTPQPPAKRFGKFDAEGAPLAFYCDDIWDGSNERLTIPADAIPLTEVQYRQLLNNQPNSRFIDGEVVMLEPPPPPPPPVNPLDEIMKALSNINVRLERLENK